MKEDPKTPAPVQIPVPVVPFWKRKTLHWLGMGVYGMALMLAGMKTRRDYGTTINVQKSAIKDLTKSLVRSNDDVQNLIKTLTRSTEALQEQTNEMKKLGDEMLRQHRALLKSLPRMEDELKKLSLSPALARELAPGQDVRVIKDDHAGKVQMSILFGDAVKKKMAEKSIAAFAMPLANAFDGICVVYLKEHKYWSSTTPDFFLPFATQKQQWQATVAHEGVHCDPENQALERLSAQEAHADRKGFHALAKALRKPALERNLMLANALAGSLQKPYDNDHDTALEIDLRTRGGKIPPAEDLEVANGDARRAVDERNLTGLSEEAAHRVALYHEALAQVLEWHDHRRARRHKTVKTPKPAAAPHVP